MGLTHTYIVFFLMIVNVIIISTMENNVHNTEKLHYEYLEIKADLEKINSYSGCNRLIDSECNFITKPGQKVIDCALIFDTTKLSKLKDVLQCKAKIVYIFHKEEWTKEEKKFIAAQKNIKINDLTQEIDQYIKTHHIKSIADIPLSEIGKYDTFALQEENDERALNRYLLKLTFSCCQALIVLLDNDFKLNEHLFFQSNNIIVCHEAFKEFLCSEKNKNTLLNTYFSTDSQSTVGTIHFISNTPFSLQTNTYQDNSLNNDTYNCQKYVYVSQNTNEPVQLRNSEILKFAITEKALSDIKYKAKQAWPDIENEKAFNGELQDFMNKNSNIPFIQENNDDYYFRLAQDLFDPIWFYTIKSTNHNDCIHILSTKKSTYARFIPKAIIIKKNYMDRKGLTSNSEKLSWKAYYELLKNLFLEEGEEKLLLQIGMLLKNNEKVDSVKVCVLKDEIKDLKTKTNAQYIFYTAHIPYSVMATFLLHKLLKKIEEEHNQETNNANVKEEILHKEKKQDDNTEKMNDKEELKANDNNLNNNQINNNNQRCMLASLSTAVILSIFLIKFMSKKHNKKAI